MKWHYDKLRSLASSGRGGYFESIFDQEKIKMIIHNDFARQLSDMLRLSQEINVTPVL